MVKSMVKFIYLFVFRQYKRLQYNRKDTDKMHYR